MDLRDKFEKRIKKKEQDIADLEIQIKEAKIYIQALQDSMKDLPKNNTNGITKTKLRLGSMCHKTYELLKETKKPMHIKDIVEGIGLEFNKSNRASLRGSMGPYLKDGRIFKQIGPAIFGLIELEYDEIQEAKPKKKLIKPIFSIDENKDNREDEIQEDKYIEPY